MKKIEFIQFLKGNRKFMLLWISQILSLVTVNMVNFMMMTRIYNSTGSSLAVSFLWIFFYIPTFFVGPFSGLFIDHWSKRKVLFYTNILQALTVLFFFLVGEKIYPLYPFVFLYSLIDEFYAPAESSSLPSLVNKNDLPLANSLFFITSQGALVLGFALSGAFINLFGQNSVIFIASVLLFIAALSVYLLPKDKPAKMKIDNISRFWKQLKEGYQFIISSKIVLFPMILAVSFGVILSSIGVSLPALASQVFNIAVKDAGLLIIVPLGLGAFTGIEIITKISKNVRKKQLIKTGLIITVFVLVFLSLFIKYFGQFILPVGILLSYILGIGGLLIIVPNQTMLQENIPAELRGRVFGTLGFATTALTLPILLFSATIIDILGIKTFLFLAALIISGFLLLLKRAETAVIAQKNGT